MTRLFLLICALGLATALPAQTCSPSDTLRITRQGAALWYILVDGDTLRHQAGGPPRGFQSEGVAAAHAVALRALTGRTIELHQTYRGRVLGCLVLATDRSPAAPPDPAPADTVVPATLPLALGTITCRPESACIGDARASVGDSVQWYAETGPGTGALLTDRTGPFWSSLRVGFGSASDPAGPRTRIWWIVAWLGGLADTASVVWTVPVSEPTVWAAMPPGTVIGAGRPVQRWITEHLTEGGAVYHWMPAGGSVLVQRCGGLWLGAAWAPAESLRVGRVDRVAVEEGMVTCRGVIP